MSSPWGGSMEGWFFGEWCSFFILTSCVGGEDEEEEEEEEEARREKVNPRRRMRRRWMKTFLFSVGFSFCSSLRSSILSAFMSKGGTHADLLSDLGSIAAGSSSRRSTSSQCAWLEARFIGLLVPWEVRGGWSCGCCPVIWL